MKKNPFNADKRRIVLTKVWLLYTVISSDSEYLEWRGTVWHGRSSFSFRGKWKKTTMSFLWMIRWPSGDLISGLPLPLHTLIDRWSCQRILSETLRYWKSHLNESPTVCAGLIPPPPQTPSAEEILYTLMDVDESLFRNIVIWLKCLESKACIGFAVDQHSLISDKESMYTCTALHSWIFYVVFH